ncbi:MAG: hypothetical protein ACI9ZV_000227 [Candidatus Azotimanducaceae bacterium]|jgi:hypothetical protein
MLTFYIGKKTPERQEFIIDNLKVEKNTTAAVAQLRQWHLTAL